MASFTDQIMSFSPYQQQLPVDDYIRVGMEKQKRYEEGVATVQSYIDSIAGIDVVKGVHKDYLNQRANQLNTAISQTLSEDFSNKALVGQLGSLAANVIKDPIVQNAVVSTTRYKSELAKMEKARADKSSSPSNEWLFQTQAERWLTDGDAKSAFNAEYIPYTDYSKKVMEAIKAVDSSSKLSQLPFARDAQGNTLVDVNGKPVVDTAMLEIHYEGKQLSQIRAAIQGALTEADLRQLQIDGLYHFRGHTPEILKKSLDTTYQEKLTELNRRRQLINVKRAEAVGDKEKLKLLNTESAQIEDEADNLVNDYQQDFNDLNANPDGFKSKFYVTNYINTLSSAYSTMKEEIKYLKNPYMDQQNLDRQYLLDVEKLKVDIENKRADREAKAKAGKPVIIPGQLPFGVDTSRVTKPTEEIFLRDIQEDDAYIKGLEAQAISTMPDDGSLSADEKKSVFYTLYDSWQKTGNFQGDPALKEYFELIQDTKQQVDNKKHILSEVTATANRNFSAGRGEKITMGQTEFSPEEVSAFNSNFAEIVQIQPTGVGTPEVRVNEALAGQLSPKERDLYKIALKHIKGKEPLSKGERIVAEGLIRNRQARRGIGDQGAAFQARQGSISEQLSQRIPGLYQPRGGGFAATTPEARKALEANISPFILRAEREGGGMEEEDRFDVETSRKMLASPDTEFNYITEGDKAYIIMQNPKGETQYIPATRREYEGVFKESLWSPTQFIEDAIVQSGPKASTNVRGKGAETALLGKRYFPGVASIGVKADLRRTVKGNYAVDLHIFDQGLKRWVTVPYPITAPTPQTALDAFKVLTDEDLLNLIK